MTVIYEKTIVSRTGGTYKLKMHDGTDPIPTLDLPLPADFIDVKEFAAIHAALRQWESDGACMPVLKLMHGIAAQKFDAEEVVNAMTTRDTWRRPPRMYRTMSKDRVEFSLIGPFRALFNTDALHEYGVATRELVLLGIVWINKIIQVHDDTDQIEKQHVKCVMKMVKFLDLIVRNKESTTRLREARDVIDASESANEREVVDFNRFSELYQAPMIVTQWFNEWKAPYEKLNLIRSRLMPYMLSAAWLRYDEESSLQVWNLFRDNNFYHEDAFGPLPFYWFKALRTMPLDLEGTTRYALPRIYAQCMIMTGATLAAPHLRDWPGYGADTNDFHPTMFCMLHPQPAADVLLRPMREFVVPQSHERYYVTAPNGDGDRLRRAVGFQFNTTISINRDTALVFPWYWNVKTVTDGLDVLVKGRSGRSGKWMLMATISLISLPSAAADQLPPLRNFMRGVGMLVTLPVFVNIPTWVVAWIVILYLIPGADAATPVDMGSKAAVSTGFFAFVFLLLFQYLQSRFPKLRKVVRAAMMEEDSERSYAERGMNIPQKRSGIYEKPHFTAAEPEARLPSDDGDFIGPRPEPPKFTIAERAKIRAWLHAESNCSRVTGKKPPFHNHNAEKKNYLLEARAVVEALFDDDSSFRDWAITEMAKGNLSLKWIHSNRLAEVTDKAAKFAIADLKMPAPVTLATRIRDVGKSVVVRCSNITTRSDPHGSLLPEIACVARVADHPLFDLLRCVIRAMCTPWLKVQSNAGYASIGLDFATVMYRLYNALPKTRLQVVKMMLEAVVPGAVFRGDEPPEEENKSWLASLMTLNIDWAVAREGAKWAASKLLAFVALIPTLWNPLMEGETISECFMNVAKDIKKHQHVTAVIDAVFGLLETGFCMIAYGSLGGGFSLSLRKHEEAYTQVKLDVANFIQTGGKMADDLINQLTSLIGDFNDVRRRLKALPEQKHCSERVIALDLLRRELMAYLDSQGNSYAPRAIALSGGPGVGKSTGINALVDTWLTEVGATARTGYMNEADAFDSKLEPHHNVVLGEDVGQTQEPFMKQPAGAQVIRFCTSTPVPLIKADLDGKKCGFSHLMVMGLTSNTKGCRLNVGITNTGAVARRVVEFYVTIDESIARRNPENKTWQPREKQRVKEPSHLLFQRVECLVGTDDTSWNPRVEGPVMNWENVQRYLKAIARDHHDEQSEMLESKSCSRARCEHYLYAVNCEECCKKVLTSSWPERAIVNIASKWLMELVDVWWVDTSDMSEDDLYRKAAKSTIFASIFAILTLLAVFVTGSCHCGLLCFALTCYYSVEILMCTGAVQRIHLAPLTLPERQNTALANDTFSKEIIIGGLTASACLMALAGIRKCSLAGAEITGRPEIENHLLPSDLPEKAEDSPDDESEEEMEVVDVASMELARVTDIATRAKTGDLVTVSEVKELIANEEEVVKNFKEALKENYWAQAIRVKPVSLKGSGATNESVLEAIRANTFYLLERGPNVVRRVVIQLESGRLLMNRHYLKTLKDKEYYYVQRATEQGGLFRQQIKFDAGAVVCGDDDIDVCIVRTSPIHGGCASIVGYIPETISKSCEMSALMLKPVSATQSFENLQVNASFFPNQTTEVEDVRVHGYLSFRTPHQVVKGWCGSPIVVNRSFVGIVCYGYNYYTGGGGQLITGSLIRALLKASGSTPGSDVGFKQDYRSAELKLVDEHPRSPTNFVAFSGVYVYGCVERSFSLRTSLHENPLAERFEQVLGTKLVGTFAPARGSFNEVAHKMLTVAAAPRGEGLFSEFKAATDEFLEGMPDVVKRVLQENPWLTRGPMGITAAAFGLKGNPYQNGVDPSKSAGQPHLKKKGAFIELIDHDTKLGKLRSDYEHDIIDIIHCLHLGECTGTLGNTLGKDEPLPFKKEKRLGHVVTVLKAKRGFIGCSSLMQIVAKMYLGPAMDVMQRAHLFFCNAVGVDPGSSEWSDLIDHLMKDADPNAVNTLSLDQASYDLTHHAALNESLAQVFIEVSRELGFTEKDLTIVSILANELQSMYIVLGGPICKFSMWPSGIPITAIGGAIKTVIQMFAAVKRQIGNVKVRDYMTIIALGDDNLHVVKKGFALLDTGKLSDFYHETGMEITSDTKEGAIVYVIFTDSQFLSRSTVFHEELKRAVGRLKLASLYRPLVIMPKSADLMEYMSDVCNSMMREAALHGREFFDHLRQAYQTIFSEKRWPLPIAANMTYDDYIAMIQERDATKDRRAILCGGLEEETGVSDTLEIREIEEPGELETTSDIAKVEGSAYRVHLNTRTLPPYINREVRHGTYVLGKDLQQSWSFNPLETIRQSDFLRQRLSTHTAIKMDLIIRFAVTGTRFHYGSFMAYPVYRPSLLDFQSEDNLTHNFRVLLGSQRNPLYFQIGDGEIVAELRVPFFWPDAMMQLNAANIADYCAVKIITVTPPRCAVDDTSSDPTLSIYVRMENVQALGHTPRVLAGASPEEGKAKPSSIIGRAARLADAVARIPGMNLPASIAAGVLHGASDLARAAGYSKPIQHGASSYVPFLAPATASANTDIVGRVLAYDVHQGVSLEPNIGPYGGHEELGIKHLVSMENVLATGRIPFQTEGSSFFRLNVTPAIELYDGGNCLLSSQGLVSSMREYWHGTMVYRFEVLTTGLTGGKIMVQYNADGNEDVDLYEVLDSFVLDLKASHVLTIRVNWMTYRNWLYTFKNGGLSTIFGPYDDTCHNGSLRFSIAQRLVGTTVDQPVDFILSAHMEDEIFMNPQYCLLAKRAIVAMNPPGDGEEHDADTLPPRLRRRRAGELITKVRLEEPFHRNWGEPTPQVDAPIPTGMPFESSTPAPSAVPLLTAAPVTNAPTQTAPPPTIAPYASTQAPVQPTQAPVQATVQPSLRPTIFKTLFPTQAPLSCEPKLQTVPMEWFAARNHLIPRSKTVGALKFGSNIEFRVPVVSDLTLRTYATARFSVRGVWSIPGNLNPSATHIFINGYQGTAPLISRMFANGRARSAVDLSEFQVHLPEDMVVKERSPEDLLAFARTVGGDGVIEDYTIPETGYQIKAFRVTSSFTLPPSIDGGMCNVGAGSGSLAYTGVVKNPNGSTITAIGGYFSEKHEVPFEIQVGAKLFAAVRIEELPKLRGEEAASCVFEVGEPLKRDSDMITVHAGEDLISLRQDLKVFRPAGIAQDSQPFIYKVHVHAHPKDAVTPFTLLQNCFGASRGGMVAWYRLNGEGLMFVQRGTGCGEADNLRYSRGYECADTRVNPSLMAMFPWYSPTRFDYARGAFVGSTDTYREVIVQPRGGEVILTEDISIGEDFSFFLFMGAPVMTRV